MNNPINRNSSQEEKKELSEVVYAGLAEYLFEKVVFLNLVYSDLGGGGTISTTDYATPSRIIDTANGRLMAVGKDSRMRCQFYLKNFAKTDGYLLSPSCYDGAVLPSPFTDVSVLRSYVGLKFSAGEIMVAVKEAGKEEVTYPIDFEVTLFSPSFTDTFALEIRHNVTFTDIYLNNKLMGSYSTDMAGTFGTAETFYAFFAPARSTDGTQVNIVAENIQFIQNK